MQGRTFGAVLALALLAPRLAADARDVSQAGCPPPPSASRSDRPNIFSAQQEVDLGDAASESERDRLRPVDAPQLLAYLARIGERLLRHMPESELRFRFALSDVPEVNAFTLPGGRVYVTRKLAAFARTEDELAGVLAHELGHGLMHDGAVDTTRRLREVLGVTRLGDRADVFDKYHQLLESVARKPEAHQTSEKHEQGQQANADAIAIHALARAGYAPGALAAMWDRFAETGGRTGNWLSDFVGATRPESRRLREMLKAQGTLQAACIEPSRAAAPEEFAAWQAQVVAYAGAVREERLPSLVWRKTLEPPLQADVRHVRFSPDGRFVLAQDEASIAVLSTAPLAPLFRVEAEEAQPAQFSPDSRTLVFHTRQLRVERWDVATGARLAVHELTMRELCLETALSPDGHLLACYDAGQRLALVDVEKGTPVFEKKGFVAVPLLPGGLPPILADLLESLRFDTLQFAFSADGRHFVAGAEQTDPVAFDIVAGKALPLPGAFRDLTQRSFAFVGSDGFVGVSARDPEKSALVRFPSGEPLGKLAFSRVSRLERAAGGDRVLVRPLGKYPVGAVDPKTRRVLIANTLSNALDLHGDLYVNELGDGTLDLRRLLEHSSERVASVSLPRSRLGRLRAAALTPDLKWLTVSHGTRGAVWNLERGERVLQVRGFRGAHVGSDDTLLAEFPDVGEAGRSLARMGLPRGELREQRRILSDLAARQFGAHLLVLRSAKKDGPGDVTLEVRDARSDDLLWSRPLVKGLPMGGVWPDEDTLTLAWSVLDREARDQIDRDPVLKRRCAAMKQQEGASLLEVLDVGTGRQLARVLVDSSLGPFRIERASGEWLVLHDAQRRVLVHALASGEPRGRFFGDKAALSGARGLLCVENEPGRATVHALASLEQRAELVFSSPIALLRFTPDGKRLFVLTVDQTAYAFDAERW